MTSSSKNSQAAPFLVISAHDYRSRRKGNIHFITRELEKHGKTRFFSAGFSVFSEIKQDPRCFLKDRANKPEFHENVECYLWKTLLHPIKLDRFSLTFLEHIPYKLYIRAIPPIFRQWIKESNTIIIESGISIIFFDLIKHLNPEAKIIYRVSDTLETIQSAQFLKTELRRTAPLFDIAALISNKMKSSLPESAKTIVIPQAMDMEVFQGRFDSPYQGGQHIATVGSMLFDPSFFEIAADAFPDITFHVIGAGKKASTLNAPNIKVYDEMPFEQTLPYLKHANAGVAPYDSKKVAPYLIDTSLKLMQFSALGVPAICPEIVTGDHKERFGYISGDKDLIIKAINAALEFGKFKPRTPQTWDKVTEKLLESLTQRDSPK